MALLKRRKKNLPSLDEIKKEDKNNIRNTQKWKYAYQKFLEEAKIFKSEESYMKHIDKMVQKEVNNKNIISSWNNFKPNDYDSYFKEKIKEFGSEENYYKWLDEEKERIEKEERQKYEEYIKNLNLDDYEFLKPYEPDKK